MAYEPYLIADYRSGVRKDLSAWLLPKDAFQSLSNGYIQHGIINKRDGMQFLAEMVHQQTTILAITAANPGQVTLAAAAGLNPGDEVQISYANGGSFSNLNGGRYVITNLVGATFDLYDTDGATVNTSTFGVYGGAGVLNIFPQLPIMGLKKYSPNSFTDQYLVFDTQRAAIYNSSIGAYDPIDTADIFTGDNSNFISVGYFGTTSAFATPTLFISNFNGNSSGVIDNMRTYTGGTTTTAFVPDSNPTGAGNDINAAQFIFSLKQRLVLLNTIEGAINTQYPQRARWSRALNPAAGGSNWDDVTPGLGGFVDAPTGDFIVSATLLQDQIVVFFSNSTWLLQPTSDPALPFRWKKLNNFRASDAPYGTIAYDRYSTSLGVRGIFGTDGIEVKRIDDKITDFVIEDINIDNIHKCFSERNYAALRSWTLYPPANLPAATTEATTSSRALIRTDEEGSWSTYTTQVVDAGGTLRDMSSLGFGSTSEDYTFADFDGIVQEDLAFEDFGNETFASFYIQARTELFLGGDQVGRVFILEKGGNDNGEDIDFEVISAAWNPFKEEGKEAQLGYLDIYADADVDAILTLSFYTDNQDSPYLIKTTDLLPDIGFLAQIQDVSQANPCVVTAGDHGLSTDDIVYLYGMTGIEDVQGGPYTITVSNANQFSLNGVDSSAFTAYVSGGVVTSKRFAAAKCWKRVYAGGTGYEHYIKINSTGTDQSVRIHAFLPWFRRSGTRMVQ